MAFKVGVKEANAYSKLRRSLEAFRDMERRLEAHPHWADLRLLP
jgi:hypothetical protein